MALGLKFEEKMAGYFSLDASNPEEGERKGKSTNHHLALRTQVVISNFPSFIASPQHPGNLAGSIDFLPFGNDLRAGSGAFALLNPPDKMRFNFVVYELHFSLDGHDYCLTGEKHVRDEQCVDLWPDSTTIYTHLHSGTTESGPVIGAGILKLELDDLFDVLSTIQVTGTDSIPEKSRVIAQFGKLYLGELWNTYAPLICNGIARDT